MLSIQSHESKGEPPAAMVSRQCWECGQSFDVPKTAYIPFSPKCEACLSRKAEDVQRRQIEKRDADWQRLCPATFRATDPDQLPNQQGYGGVMRWQWNPIGLFLAGETGTGKSRSLWLLIQREHKAGRTIAALRSDAAFIYTGKAMGSSADTPKWIHHLSSVSILLLDDVFKCRMSDGFEAALFAVVNSRCEDGLPILVTCNDDALSLAGRMSDDRGEPMIRRLREFTTVIPFS
jgi:hypothetical protein